MLLTMLIRPLTYGRRQVMPRTYSISGRASSSISCFSICQNQLLPFAAIGLPRLPVDQLVDRIVTISSVIAQRAAFVILVKLRIRIVDLGFGDVEPNFEILAHQSRIPLRGVHGLELAVDVDLLQLVNQDQRRIAPGRNVARRDSDGKPVTEAIAEFLHDLPRFGAPLRDIGAVARQLFQLAGQSRHQRRADHDR
jgi:hypothetical protein